MKFYAHRINNSAEIKDLDPNWGIELDLRDYDGEVIVQHDPFKSGELFKEYIKKVENRDLILNIKCERIEYHILHILNEANYTGNYFFLDSTFPMIYTLSNQGESNIALRFSEYEGIDILEQMQGKVKWVWVDVFKKLPLTKEICHKIKLMGYNICLVSPELQGHDNDIEIYLNKIILYDLEIDAICTKSYNIIRWTL